MRKYEKPKIEIEWLELEEDVVTVSGENDDLVTDPDEEDDGDWGDFW